MVSRMNKSLNRYSQDVSLWQIATALDRNVKTIRRRLLAAGAGYSRTGDHRSSYPGDDILTDLYTAQRLSTRECGRVLDVAPATIRRWLKDAGIPTRSISEAKKGQKPAPQTVEASVRARRKHVIEGKPAVGYKLRADGYVSILVHDHPFANSSGYVLEHRLVMEKKIGRYLLPAEDVHHINGVRGDNHPENLELFASRSEHSKSHDKARGRDSLGRFPKVSLR